MPYIQNHTITGDVIQSSHKILTIKTTESFYYLINYNKYFLISFAIEVLRN